MKPPQQQVPDDALPESFFAALVASLSEAIVVMDEQSVIRYFSPGASQLFGYQPDEVVGKRVEKLMVDEIAAQHAGYVRRYIETRQPHIVGRSREVTGRAKNGRSLPLDLRVVPLQMVGRRYFLGSLRDVSERKQRESALAALTEELAERNMRIDAALSHIDEGVCLYDTNLNLVIFNQRYLDLLGLPPDVVRPGLSLYALLDLKVGLGLIRDGEVAQLAERRVAMATARRPSALTLRLASGNVIRISHRPLPDGRSIATYADITEHERAAESLREAVHRAEQASQAKSNFLANMSHELRTPLNAIIGLSEALALGYRGGLNAQQTDYLRDIHAAGTHLLGIINEVLDLAKIEAGQFHMTEEIISLDDVLRRALQVVGSLARAAGIRLYLQHQDGPAPGQAAAAADEVAAPIDPGSLIDPAALRFRGDLQALSQALINLLSNAIKFTPRDGHIRLHWQLDRIQGLRIHVSDSGIGMSSADIEVALTPFGQIDNVYSRGRQGTGLGLPLAKYLTEAHGGQLSLASELGHGTCVTMQLPFDRIVEPLPARDDLPQGTASDSGGRRALLRRLSRR
ncbi:MAG TPA: PAS-domain containing protein [Terriglobia bacterium]|nr:PAS-domain containing protein [Terriglobia bacterium]